MGSQSLFRTFWVSSVMTPLMVTIIGLEECLVELVPPKNGAVSMGTMYGASLP